MSYRERVTGDRYVPKMSLVVEAWTLVVRRDALEARFPGGTAAFEAEVPNASFHCDDHLAGASFLDYWTLKDLGLRLLAKSDLAGFIDGAWQDLVPVDAIDGPNARCDWIEIETHPDGYTFCWLSGTEPGKLAARRGWTPEDARSLRSFRPSEIQEELEPVIPLYTDPRDALDRAGLQPWIVKETGEVLYRPIGRPISSAGSVAPPRRATRAGRWFGALRSRGSRRR